MIAPLIPFLPNNCSDLVAEILEKHTIKIKIVNKRTSKHGDFKRLPNGSFIITINNSLNQYQFLLTLIHEIAHFVTHKSFPKAKPHGIEWKRNFQHLMLPFVQPSIYPSTVLPLLANYLRNPKASTGADVNLAYALKQFDDISGKNFIFDVQQGSNFSYKGRIFKKGIKRRTRFECLEISSNRIYLFNQNAEIDVLK